MGDNEKSYLASVLEKPKICLVRDGRVPGKEDNSENWGWEQLLALPDFCGFASVFPHPVAFSASRNLKHTVIIANYL